MNDKQTSRRRFLVAAITFSAVATNFPVLWLKSSAAWAESEDDSGATLTRMARLLFPHDGIEDSVYAAVMSAVLTATADDPTMTSVLESAEVALDLKRGKPWISLDDAEQIAVMQELEGEAFFATILGAVRAHFYYNPAIWKYLGYPGSSREYGGYINRGFNDIDWLPGSS